jgi:hypothetical protein
MRVKSAGTRASGAEPVKALIALAEAEGNLAPQSIMSREERKLELSKLARQADSSVKIRAMEALDKLEDRETELGRAPDNDGFSEWRLVREYLQMPQGAPAIVFLWIGQGKSLSSLPLLHDVHAAVRRDAPGVWEDMVNRFTAPERVWLERHLAEPGWQLNARKQLWREVGIDIEVPSGVFDPLDSDRQAMFNSIDNGSATAEAGA